MNQSYMEPKTRDGSLTESSLGSTKKGSLRLRSPVFSEAEGQTEGDPSNRYDTMGRQEHHHKRLRIGYLWYL